MVDCDLNLDFLTLELILFFFFFFFSLNKHLLSTFYVPGAKLGAVDTKTGQSLPSRSLQSSGETEQSAGK